MSVFSRIFVVVTCLALAAGAIAIAVLAWTIPVDSIDWLRNATGWMDGHDSNTEKTILAVVCAAIALIAVVITVLELLPKSGTDVKVTDLKIGDAVLSTAAISQRVEEAVHQVPHVASVRAAVKANRKGVLVSLDLYVDPDANLATVTDEACGAATDVLTNRVHVALQQPPHARLHYRELRLRGRPVARAGGAPMEPRTPMPPKPPRALEAPRAPESPPGHLLTRQPPAAPAATPVSAAYEGAVAVAEPGTVTSYDEGKEAPAE